MKTLADIINHLRRIDEISLLEVLNISSEDIVDRFGDRIEDRYEYLREDFEDEEDEQEGI